MDDLERRKRFDELYSQFDRRVLAYCIHVVADRDAARDVFQDVFIKAYSSLHTLREWDRASNWLFRIARNECLNALKATQRSNRRSTRLEDTEPAARTSEPSISDREEARLLHEALRLLTPEHREALLLAEFEGFSLKEIADITGASVSNVKVRIHRAKQKLHAILKPILHDHGPTNA
jgi:RNA polymerase sigma-70 factor, ECF subfamily